MQPDTARSIPSLQLYLRYERLTVSDYVDALMATQAAMKAAWRIQAQRYTARGSVGYWPKPKARSYPVLVKSTQTGNSIFTDLDLVPTAVIGLLLGVVMTNMVNDAYQAVVGRFRERTSNENQVPSGDPDVEAWRQTIDEVRQSIDGLGESFDYFADSLEDLNRNIEKLVAYKRRPGNFLDITRERESPGEGDGSVDSR